MADTNKPQPNTDKVTESLAPESLAYPVGKISTLFLFAFFNLSAYSDFSSSEPIASAMTAMLFILVGFVLYPYLFISILNDLNKIQPEYQTINFHYVRFLSMLAAGGMFLINLILLLM